MEAARLRLVGSERELGPDPRELYAFYGETFGKLAAGVEGAGRLTRYVAYQGPAAGGRCLHFLGLEVESITSIPQGMVAWELAEDTWTVRAPGGDRNEPILWSWLAESRDEPGRWCGEFHRPGSECFEVAGNAYVAIGAQGDSDEVALVEYDPSWPDEARRMAAWLREALGPAIALRVEHYGSTAIPGMTAKPVVDLLMEVPSFPQAKQRALRVLNSPAWEYWWYSEHMTFVKRAALMGRRTHHVHMAPAGHRVWDAVAFRDYLTEHPEEASAYAALKRELASAHRADRERYTQAKSDFVQRVTARAIEIDPARS